MEAKHTFLLEYFDKQLVLTKKLYEEAILVDVSEYDKSFVFAIRVQQFYTALENLFKQIVKSFENYLENLQLLTQMNIEIPMIRPTVISNKSVPLLEKTKAFRHSIEQTYDCELDERELILIQKKLKEEYPHVESDLQKFRSFILKLSHD